MKTGYDQFFKKAQTAQKSAGKSSPQAAAKSASRTSPKIGQPRFSSVEGSPGKPARGGLSSAMSSQQMAQQLRHQMTPKKRAARPFPWKMIGSSLIGLVVTGFGIQNLDKVEHYFKRIEITVLGEAYAEDPKSSDKSADKKDDKAKKSDAGGAAEAKGEKTDKKDGAVADAKAEGKKEYTAEEVNHFGKLNDRKRELDAKEAELNKMEAELGLQKTELENRIQELEQTRKNISQVLEQKVQADDKKVATLVEMYSSMKPQQAAKIFETLDEDLAVEILGRMKKKNAAEVMNLVKAEKAQVFSEKYAGYKRK